VTATPPTLPAATGEGGDTADVGSLTAADLDLVAQATSGFRGVETAPIYDDDLGDITEDEFDARWVAGQPVAVVGGDVAATVDCDGTVFGVGVIHPTRTEVACRRLT
jgi:hypothetical protein